MMAATTSTKLELERKKMKMSGTSPEKLTTDSPNPSDIDIPSSTHERTPHLIDKLSIRVIKEDVLKIILKRWCLLRLSSESLSKVDTLLSVCDFKFDYDAIEDIPERKGKFEKLRKKWYPDEKQMLTLKLQENESIVNMDWLTVKLHELSFCLHSIIKETPKRAVSEQKYRTLFEKFLQLFCFNTLSQPFIKAEKTLILGRTISSQADIICSRLETTSDRPIICVCETISDKEDVLIPPLKKMKSDVQVTSRTEESDTAFSQSNPSDDPNLWTQHIGNLLVHLDKSFRNDGILGIAMEKSLVRFTYLEVSETTMKKIKETPAKSLGSLNIGESERPLFCYSETYNYLCRDDRKIIFNALMLIKKMQLDYEKVY